jgi:hypothetical protein
LTFERTTDFTRTDFKNKFNITFSQQLLSEAEAPLILQKRVIFPTIELSAGFKKYFSIAKSQE